MLSLNALDWAQLRLPGAGSSGLGYHKESSESHLAQVTTSPSETDLGPATQPSWPGPISSEQSHLFLPSEPCCLESPGLRKQFTFLPPPPTPAYWARSQALPKAAPNGSPSARAETVSSFPPFEGGAVHISLELVITSLDISSSYWDFCQK